MMVQNPNKGSPHFFGDKRKVNPFLLHNKKRPILKYIKKGTGFTLMEVIVAVAIITSTLLASINLISFSVSRIIADRSKLIAVSLAQEGQEIVRTIRDNNWLNYKRKPSDWRDALDVGNYRVQYNQSVLLSWINVPLKINASGFYQYDNGSNSPFYRKVTIEHIDDNQIKATVEVTWQEKGRDQNVKVESRLYNWLEEEE